MRGVFVSILSAAALGLAACDPHAADSADGAAAGEPADAPASAPVTDFSGDFDLKGTEPFWALTIRSDRLTLSRPDAEDFAAPNNGPQIDGPTGMWDGGPLKVTLKEEACSDGMSDRQYAYSALVSLQAAGDWKGCGDKAGTAAPAP